MNEREFDQAKMKYFVESHEGILIQSMSRGMSQDEVADFFGVEMKSLDGEDLEFFRFHYRMGRGQGMKQAVDSLFMQMGQRQGGQVALSYLARFCEEWEGDISADKEGTGKKSFRVILD